MDKYNDIKDFFNMQLTDLKYDKKLIKKLRQFRYKWSSKSDEYLDFLGSNLLGVHYVRFSELDNDSLMIDTIGFTDYRKKQKEIYTVKDMKKKYKVASNIIYQTLMYIAYRFLKNKDLNKDEKRDGIREVTLLMQYKMFTSLYSRYFPFPTSETIAHSVYNKLSYKFLIKQLENWQELFEFRVEVLLKNKSTNNLQLSKFTTLSSIELISAIQTKLRGNVKEIYAVLVETIENDEILKVESSTYTGGEGDVEQGREVTVGISTYVTRIKQISQQQNDFIDNETIKIVSTLFPNIDIDLIKKFLYCMTNDKFINPNDLNSLIEKILLISFNFLQRLDINIENVENIPRALMDVRFFWSSSKVKNKEMLDIKDKLNKKGRECINKKTGWVLTTLALSYVLYIFLRSLKK